MSEHVWRMTAKVLEESYEAELAKLVAENNRLRDKLQWIADAPAGQCGIFIKTLAKEALK